MSLANKMDFDFVVEQLLPDEVNKITGRDLCERNYRTSDFLAQRRWSIQHNPPNETNIDQLVHIVDSMGLASAKAQDLHHVITTSDKLRESEHVLYLMTDQTTATSNDNNVKVVGLLKVGYKKLFLIDRRGTQHEMRPPCVLDFYVHESCQRMGFGKRLFEFMMKNLNIKAHQLAIDRPSKKFLAFLVRHYKLSKPVHQGNHFTVFEEIFSSEYDSDLNDDTVQSRWKKLRRSDPTCTSDQNYSENFLNGCQMRSLNRNSFPPAVGDPSADKVREAGSSSVASVVFGQLRRASEEMQEMKSLPRGSFYSPNLERTMRISKGNDGCGGSNEMLRSTAAALDSSFNIFGVPSPNYSSGGISAHRG